MSFLAPYSNAMRIGQGFNSYTQEICIENAVLIEPTKKPKPLDASRSRSAESRRSSPGPQPLRPLPEPYLQIGQPPALRVSRSNQSLTSTCASDEEGQHTHRRLSTGEISDVRRPLDSSVAIKEHVSTRRLNKNIVQIVTFSSRMVDNVSEIVEALNISSSASIKYGTVKAAGSASFVNENRIESSDLNYVVTVNVTNETSPIAERMTFNPISGLENSKFTNVFGDCFISGFTEGGEFSAIVSIKVTDKNKISAVKAAAEAEITIPAAPGLSIGTRNSVARSKNDIWQDAETSISVHWAGGGDIKPPDDKWDITTVVDVASRFPHLVETCPQRTSAILTRYTSLRSFNEADARNPPTDKFQLFTAFLAYKNVWAEIAEILKHPEQYREREPTKACPNPVLLTSQSLNEARLLARKGLTQITDATKAMETRPELADLDQNGQLRKPVYSWPGELKERLPVHQYAIIARGQANMVRTDTSLLNRDSVELKKLEVWADDPHVLLGKMVGDHIGQKRNSWLKNGVDTIFCTLEDDARNGKHLNDLTRICFHGFESRSMNWLSLFGGQTRSRRCHGHLSGIGYSTSADTAVKTPEHGTHHIAGKSESNPHFWSQPAADLTRTKAAKVRIEYIPGSGCIAALTILDPSGQELTSWKAYGHAKVAAPAGLKVVEQEAPEGRGWALAGFWGHSDSRVVTKIASIWKRI